MAVFFIFYSIRVVVFAIMRRHVPDMGILKLVTLLYSHALVHALTEHDGICYVDGPDREREAWYEARGGVERTEMQSKTEVGFHG